MANITHTSTGASNTPRLLEVTGTVLELPKQENLWLDFQIDSGITVAAGRITQWIDSKNNNAVVTHGTAPIEDVETQLFGMASPKFGGTYPNFRRLRKSGGITGAPTAAGVVTCCALFYPGNGTNTLSGTTGRIFELIADPPTGDNYNTISISEHPTNHTITIVEVAMTTHTIGTSITGQWNIVVVQVDNTTDTTSWKASLNNEATVSGTFSRRYAKPDEIIMGCYNNSAQPFFGNIGAVLVWKDVDFSDADMELCYNYLMNKYGLA